MALSNYTELQASIANWLARAALTSVIPDFIRMCETQISRRLRIRMMEADVSLTTVAGTATVSLPTGFKKARYLYIDGDPDNALTYRTPEQLTIEYPGNWRGKPRAFTLVGDKIKFGPVPDSAYTVLGTSWNAITALSDAAPTNSMLTANPDLYLYGTLLQAAPYLGQDARINVWSGFFLQILDDIQIEDDTDRHSGSTLQVRTDTCNP